MLSARVAAQSAMLTAAYEATLAALREEIRALVEARGLQRDDAQRKAATGQDGDRRFFCLKL